MTVLTALNRYSYSGDGATTTFPYTRKVFTSAEVQVYVGGVLQVSGYTVTGVGSDSGGNVVFTTAPASLAAIVILLVEPITQASVLPTSGPFPAKTVEGMSDKLTMIEQQHEEAIGRAIKFATSSPKSNVVFPEPVPNGYLQWDSTGTALRLVNAAGTVVQPPVNLPWVNVRDYGAKGDGSTDDTTFIQSAINALPTGGVVAFPPGVYKLTAALTLTNINGVIFRGAGRDVTTLKQTAAANCFTFTGSVDIDWLVVEDMTLDGNLVGLKGITTAIGKDLVFQRLRIVNFLGHGIEYTGNNTLHNVVRDSRIVVPAGAAAGTRCIMVSGGNTLHMQSNYYINLLAANAIGVDLSSSSGSGFVSISDIMDVGTAAFKMNGDLTVIGAWFQGLTNSVIMTANAMLVMLGCRGVDITSVDTDTNGVSRQYVYFIGESQGQIGGGPLLNKILSPAQIAADQNNYAPTGGRDAGIWFLTTDAARNLTGIKMGAGIGAPDFPSGARISLYNTGSFPLVLKHESASSTAQNRFHLLAGTDLMVPPNGCVAVVWDGTLQRWRDEQNIIVHRRATLAYSASIAVDASAADEFDISATNGVAFTIQNPTNHVDGQLVTFTILNTSGGALGALTWSANYKLSAWTQPANTFNRSITFRSNGAILVQISQTGVDVPN